VFFFNGEKNIVRSAISWFTRSPHYHVNIAFWMQGREGTERLMLAESQPGGFRLINLGFCRDRTMTVFERPVDWGLIRDTVVGTPGGVSYDFLDLFLIGMHERFGTPDRNASRCHSQPGNLHHQFLENKLEPYMVSHG